MSYKPTEHDGKTLSGEPDKRVSSEHGFGGSDGPDPHVEGQKGGKASGGGGAGSGGEAYKPTEHGGLKQDGTPDKRVSSEHGFGGSDGPDPHVEGQKGGSK
ncbi:hypothetical protein BD324DRAFT_650149 [Kockovaella imperatae]|uniref:Uncharacterized protein n=1 Tax=Kockovaella imperatae TaxID=4999 RepID=A0A1Y1UJ50_9TREE|nr:hypothetical protein BD324DRAFT_650149 [Kockovaella imperatae]ORX37577.1 hypothetical protein BD324DRAFT_650149 [Kockovaella imperatae]